MIKKAFALMMLMICVIGGMKAQQNPMLAPLPLNPDVKHGVLDNGLTYYVLHNEEPKQRANFYIAQKVGSSLETQEQLGLAHFLEHMAFNGTSHYPGKKMLNYLEANGIRFGADINAMTGFDVTIYNIDNVPTTNQALMDSVLLVLRDWSCDILLEEDEIDAERKVIQEEWRSRDVAQLRALTASLPVIVDAPQYQQLPIGTMDVVMNFPYQAIRDYYHKWYRPDQQGIVVVGDFDAAEMEDKIKNMFSSIPMPENAAERTYAPIGDNEKPIYFEYEDPELTYSLCTVSIKMEKMPTEIRNTIAGYVQDAVIEPLICSMINQRLNEESQKPDCPFSYAGVYFSDYSVTKTKYSFNVRVLAKDNMAAATSSALEIVARALKAGFSETEMKRVADSMLANYEKAYNEKDKTQTEALAQELISNFTDNVSAPGITTEYQLMQQLLPNIPVEEVNALAAQVITPTNLVVQVNQPKKEGYQLPGETVMLTTVADAFNKEYEAYVDEVVTEPLIAKLPKKGSVKSQKENPVFGTTEMTLSNGAKVIVKPTDFAADEIIFQAVRKGGKESYPLADASNLKMVNDAFEYVMFGPFDTNMLRKYLAGKKVSLGYNMGRTTTGFRGSSTKKDIPTLMELIYTGFTNLGPDKEKYDAMISGVIPMYQNMDKNADYQFKKALINTRFGNNPMVSPVGLEDFQNADYDRMLEIVKNSTTNAADYTFIFTGNVDAETLTPYLEQYIASLPSKGKAQEPKVVTPIKQAQGKVDNRFDFEMEQPSTQIYQVYTGSNLKYSPEAAAFVSMVGSVLNSRFHDEIREKEGGAYSPGAGGYFDNGFGTWTVLGAIQTNSEQQARMIELAQELFLNLLNNGATPEEFNKVKEAELSQLENSVRTNSYWHSAIVDNVVLGLDEVTNAKESIQAITLEDFNKQMKNLYNGENMVEVVMTGIPAQK